MIPWKPIGDIVVLEFVPTVSEALALPDGTRQRMKGNHFVRAIGDGEYNPFKDSRIKIPVEVGDQVEVCGIPVGGKTVGKKHFILVRSKDIAAVVIGGEA